MARRREEEQVLYHPTLGIIPIAMIQTLYGQYILDTSERILTTSAVYYRGSIPNFFQNPPVAGGKVTGYDGAGYDLSRTWQPSR